MNSQLVIGCDLFSQQRLYQVPSWGLEKLSEIYPFIKIVRIDSNRPQEILDRDIEVYWGNYLTRQIVNQLPQLKWIHFGSVGINRALCPEVKERQIHVTNSRAMLVAPVAATIIAMMSSLARGLHRCFQLRAQNRLDRDTLEPYFEEMHDLQNERCLLVGLGEIGTRVATVCSALAMRITAIKKNPDDVPPFVEKIFHLNQLGEAVKDADYVINLLPLTPETRGVFSHNIFQQMKPSSLFINTGRGGTVVEPDLIEAIEQRTIAGAGLDVFSQEPLPLDSPLWTSNHVILTPHVACLSNHYWPQQITLMEKNIGHYVKNQPLINRVDISRGY